MKIQAYIGKYQQGPGLPADGLSRKEVLELSGLTIERLGIWYNRKLLSSDFLEAHSGRGNRTRFSVQEAYFLSLTRILADKGMPVNEAAKLSMELFSFFGFTKYDLIKAENHKANPLLIVPHPVNDNQFVIERVSTAEELVALLRVRQIRAAVILDINEIYLDFRRGLAEVLAMRNK